jgi:hypothetical protein
VSWAVNERSVDESPPHRGLIKLVCLSLAGLSVLVARSLPDREKGALLRSALALLANVRLGWKCHTL